MGYREMPTDAMQAHDTWIIAFCLDSNSFFATDQRAFFWESKDEFSTEEDAIDYFEKHVSTFTYIATMLTNEYQERVYLENTGKWYI